MSTIAWRPSARLSRRGTARQASGHEALREWNRRPPAGSAPVAHTSKNGWWAAGDMVHGPGRGARGGLTVIARRAASIAT